MRNNSECFFENRECSYFPCHKGLKELNCLFCYCPLYPLKNCPGNPKLIKSGERCIKDCSGCDFPHKPENYEKVVKILAQR